MQQQRILITGGAGFIGSNLADSLLTQGHRVTILDALLRPGSELNLWWLQRRHPHVEFIRGDVREGRLVAEAAADADVIYHLAAQVAVTSSVIDPQTDFEINGRGTFHVLEAARRSERQPVVVYTSTNKVYGGIEDVVVEERPDRYEFRDRRYGIAEDQRLDFHSPYGCSKGTGDQYVRDYARIYGLRTVVFRMSCIYGPRQFGNEDQGWLAHFLIAAVTGKPITIYGDGKQVRDILFVDDLVRALQLAVEAIDVAAGQIYNIGGGPENALAVWREFGPLVTNSLRRRIDVGFSDWRPGDQRCYVSDIRKARRDLGWQPRVDKATGIQRLLEWVSANTRMLEEIPSNGHARLSNAELA
jgi:CDP-paratose 2-epimerase